MKTKLLLLVAVAVAFIKVPHVSAQQFYVAAVGGYNFSAPGNIIGTDFIFDDVGNDFIQENVCGTYGKGLNEGVLFGYSFSEYISAEIGSSYLHTEGYETKTGDPRYPYFVFLTMHKAEMTRLFSAVKITVGDKLKPYARFGFVYGIGQEIRIDNVSFPLVVFRTYSGGSAPGMLATLGAEYKLKGKFYVFLEGNFIYQVYSPDKLEEYDLVNTTTYQLVDRANSSNTNQRLRSTFSFSSIGINTGIKFLFGKEK